MSNPRAQQQAVVAQIKTISQTSITDGLYSLKAFRTFQVSSIQCPSTPHFIAINRGESSWVGPRNMPCPSLCMRRRQTTHTPGFFWEQFQHPAHSAMSPIKHSWFIWILYYNVLNFSCMYPPPSPHTHSTSHPLFWSYWGKKEELIKHWRRKGGGKNHLCHFHTHKEACVSIITTCLWCQGLFFSWCQFIYKAWAGFITCTLETQTQGRGIIRGIQVSS